MWLEAAHIDKDAQDLSRVIVGTRPTRHSPRAAIAHSYIQHYNECSQPPAPIRAFRLRMRLYANSPAPVHRQVRSTLFVV